MRALEQLEQEGLDGDWRRDDHRARLTRFEELFFESYCLRGGGEALEAEGVDGLAHDGAEGGADHRTRHVEQRLWHALHHQPRSIRQHQREQRRDHSRLAAALHENGTHTRANAASEVGQCALVRVRAHDSAVLTRLRVQGCRRLLMRVFSEDSTSRADDVRTRPCLFRSCLLCGRDLLREWLCAHRSMAGNKPRQGRMQVRKNGNSHGKDASKCAKTATATARTRA
eukprot:5023476-Pleurochrysis_carterae.AAC.1